MGEWVQDTTWVRTGESQVRLLSHTPHISGVSSQGGGHTTGEAPHETNILTSHCVAQGVWTGIKQRRHCQLCRVTRKAVIVLLIALRDDGLYIFSGAAVSTHVRMWVVF